MKIEKGDPRFKIGKQLCRGFFCFRAVFFDITTVASLGDIKMALGVKFAFSPFLGGLGGTPGVPLGAKLKMLNFELLRQVRGRNASFLGADFSRAFKTTIFGLLGGSRAVLGTPGGTLGGQKLKNAQL